MIRALLIVAALLLTGCSAAPDAPGAPLRTLWPQLPGVDVAASQLPAATPLPTLRLRIPDIDVDQPLEPLGRDQAGRLAAPPVTEPEMAGWYEAAPTPGDVGPAIVAGHVSGRPAGADRSVPGVFARLAQLIPGDTVHIDRDGQPLQFKVYRVGTFPKNGFPTADVYGDTPTPELRLITCGGVFDPAAHSYESNVVVWAQLSTDRTGPVAS